MTWLECDKMSLREEFVLLTSQDNCNFSKICKRFNISRPTGYKWLKRYKNKGLQNLIDKPRVRKSINHKTDKDIEDLIIELRNKHLAWGPRKLKRRLENLGNKNIPSHVTVGNILKRNNMISSDASNKAKAFIRFEHPNPNDLWQMDFKGWFETDEARCYPLTVLDDHSRFSIILKACYHERTEPVKDELSLAFKKYGLPKRMTMDNGSPWGGSERKQLTKLTAWLIRLGIKVSHSRPYHPQTQGKDERFHRTLKAELLRFNKFSNLSEVDLAFKKWRHIYNTQRPHEALTMDVPIDHYNISKRIYPEILPELIYADNDVVRKVNSDGRLSIDGIVIMISRALVGQKVALRKSKTGIDIYYCHQKIKSI
jgi:transposase InsO family protein